jgi:hypothetical protein
VAHVVFCMLWAHCMVLSDMFTHVTVSFTVTSYKAALMDDIIYFVSVSIAGPEDIQQRRSKHQTFTMYQTFTCVPSGAQAAVCTP